MGKTTDFLCIGDQHEPDSGRIGAAFGWRQLIRNPIYLLQDSMMRLDHCHSIRIILSFSTKKEKSKISNNLYNLKNSLPKYIKLNKTKYKQEPHN